MNIMISIAYFISSIIIILLPGPGSIYTISTAMNHRNVLGIYAAIGCTLGILPHLFFGISAMMLLQQLPTDFMEIVKIMGTFYLIYLGYSMIKGKGQMDLSSKNQINKWKVLNKGAVLNLLNPQLTLFFISFLPQYIDDNGPYLFQTLILGLIFMILTLIVFIGYGLMANRLSKRFLGSPKRLILINRVFGGIFILFAVKLLY